MRIARCFYIASICLSLATSISVAESPNENASASQRDAWSAYYAAQLPQYKFFLADRPDQPLELPDATLRWSNPLRPGTHGDMFVWSHQGRGVLVGSLFSYYHAKNVRRVAHQFQSLTTDTIVCQHTGGSDFRIEGPGLKFTPIQDAPAPADNRVVRLTQMRMLSRSFKASCMNKGVYQPLRGLPQPVYRFEGEAIEDDGAIFAYVMGTDPELLLVISVHQTPDGPQWQYAAARFASEPLQLTRNGETVWDFDDTSKQLGYLSKHGIDLQPDMPMVNMPSE